MKRNRNFFLIPKFVIKLLIDGGFTNFGSFGVFNQFWLIVAARFGHYT